MKKILIYLPSIFFNICETVIIFLIGYLMNLKILEILIITCLFSIVRTIIGGALHYKQWQKCLVWSTLVFSSIFLVAKINMNIAICVTIFEAYILTRKSKY